MFGEDGSTAPSGIPTVAVLLIVPVADAFGVAVRLKVAVPPFFKSTLALMPPVPETVWQAEPSDAVQVHEAFVKTAERVSTTGIPKTSFGPLLRTVITYVVGAPGTDVA